MNVAHLFTARRKGDPPPAIVIAHDYLTQRGGAERVVLAMCEAFPDAPIYTTFYEPTQTYPAFAQKDIRTSWLNRFGPLRRNPKLALLLLPLIVWSRKIDARVLLVSSSGWAHGFRTTGRKIVYCHAPARWLYQTAEYLPNLPPGLSRVVEWLLAPLRIWDQRAGRTATQYLANSRIVESRIGNTYRRAAEVLHPPVHLLTPANGPDLGTRSDYHLVVSRLMNYKNVGAVVETFRRLPERRLVVVGSGPLLASLLATAPPNVTILSGLTDAEMTDLYRGATAVICAGYDDFGLTPIEAASFGKPTLALRYGGYLDSVAEGVSGLYFDSPTPDAIGEGIARMDHFAWDTALCLQFAAKFTVQVFMARLREVVDGGVPQPVQVLDAA